MLEFTVDLGAAGLVADDDLGRWMETHGVDVAFTCMLGRYDATVTWRKIHSYSDAEGTHHEQWSLTRSDRDLGKAVAKAMREAYDRTQAPKTPRSQ